MIERYAIPAAVLLLAMLTAACSDEQDIAPAATGAMIRTPFAQSETEYTKYSAQQARLEWLKATPSSANLARAKMESSARDSRQ
jgi:hypothetical protein